MLIRGMSRFAELRLAGAVERPGHPLLGQDAATAAGVAPAGVLLGDALEDAIAAADVVIDFSAHEAVPATAALAAKLGKGIVIGITGLNADEAARVQAASRDVPVVWAPNMSLGMNLLFALTEQASRMLGIRYDVEIVETHHRHKKDAPSGTALRLGECVAAGRSQNFEEVAVHGRQGLIGERPQGEIGMHALRAGDVVGDHTVLFSTEGECIELRHRATSRDTFAMGALRAALWVTGRPAGMYDMKHVLGLE